MSKKILIIPCLAILLGSQFTKTPADAAAVKFADNPVIAHRGAFKAKHLPENSIASLREAITLGATGSETDIRMTADGVLVINHDPDYRGLDIETHTYLVLSTHTLPNSEPLPTLRAYLHAAIEAQGNTRLLLEIKPTGQGSSRAKQIAQQVVSEVEESGASDMAEYISFDYDTLKYVLEEDGFAKTYYLNGDKAPEILKEEGITGLDYNLHVLRRHPEWINAARANNLAIGVWTVNQPQDLQWCLQQGFDFITTDEPEWLLAKAQEMGRSSIRSLGRL